MVHLWLLLQVQTWNTCSLVKNRHQNQMTEGDSSGPPVVEIFELVKEEKQSYC